MPGSGGGASGTQPMSQGSIGGMSSVGVYSQDPLSFVDVSNELVLVRAMVVVDVSNVLVLVCAMIVVVVISGGGDGRGGKVVVVGVR
jgi:hypothetical protein